MIVDVISGFLGSGKTSLVGSLAADARLGEFFLLSADSLEIVAKSARCLSDNVAGGGQDAVLQGGSCRMGTTPLNVVKAFAEGGRESDGNRGRLGLLPKERLGRTHRQKEQGQKEQGPVQWPVLALIGDEVQDQIRGVALDFHPERLIIEPSTAAAVPGVLEGIRRVSIEGFVRRIRRILVLDASTFGKYYASSTRFVESRIEVSDLVVVNKCDLVEPREALWIQDVVGRVNREARALLASFGRVDGEEFRSEALPPELDDGKAEIECCSSAFTGAFDRDALLVLFEEFRRSDIGRVSRAKGVFRTAEGWVQIDYANGEVIVQTAADSAVSRIALIGVGIDWIQLDSKLNCCLLADLHSVEGCDNGGM